MIGIAAALATVFESVSFLVCWWGVSTYLIDHRGGAFGVTLLVWLFCNYTPRRVTFKKTP